MNPQTEQQIIEDYFTRQGPHILYVQYNPNTQFDELKLKNYQEISAYNPSIIRRALIKRATTLFTAASFDENSELSELALKYLDAFKTGVTISIEDIDIQHPIHSKKRRNILKGSSELENRISPHFTTFMGLEAYTN